jgi:hypothetical protein
MNPDATRQWQPAKVDERQRYLPGFSTLRFAKQLPVNLTRERLQRADCPEGTLHQIAAAIRADV